MTPLGTAPTAPPTETTITEVPPANALSDRFLAVGRECLTRAGHLEAQAKDVTRSKRDIAALNRRASDLQVAARTLVEEHGRLLLEGR